MHLGDDRGIQALQQQQGLVQRRQQIRGALHRVGLQGGQVAPGDEGAARALEQHGAHAGVLRNVLHGRQQGLGGRYVQRIHGLGAVE